MSRALVYIPLAMPNRWAPVLARMIRAISSSITSIFAGNCPFQNTMITLYPLFMNNGNGLLWAQKLLVLEFEMEAGG
jgi:hypothetical protein